MNIGVVREVKDGETRVGLVPSGVSMLRDAGHKVIVEVDAGAGSNIRDEEYFKAGAQILSSAEDVWRRADLIVKVKEPQAAETELFRPGLILYAYLHLAPLPHLTEALLRSKVTAIAYETIREADGSLPLLIPMSEIAGRMSIQVGATYLQAANRGRGLLLGGVPGVPPANVVILGGGIVGYNAARIAFGMGASVTIVDNNITRLRALDDTFAGRIVTVAANKYTIAASLEAADLAVGAVLVPGAFAPKLVSRKMITAMKPGSVIVDVSIDQGGCFETSRPTTHSDPTYFVDGVLHYCVTNMPGAVPQTSTTALTNATLPYLLDIANHGLEGACERRHGLRAGINTHNGNVTHSAVAEAMEFNFASACC